MSSIKLRMPGGPGSTELITFDQHTLFDPRVNKWYGVAVKGTSIDHMKQWWKAIYTHENMLANPVMFFPYLYDYGLRGDNLNTFVKNAFSKVDADKFWAFGFLQFNGLIANRGVFMEILHARPTVSTPTIKYYEVYCKDSYYGPSYIANNGNDIAEHMAKVIHELAEYWTTKLAEFTVWHPNMGINVYGIERYFGEYLKNNRFYAAGGGVITDRPQTPAEFLNTINAQPGIQLTAQLDGMYLNIAITKRVTDEDRSALHQLLQYRASPLNYIKWPIVTKTDYEPRLYGVELEVATNYSVKELVDAGPKAFLIAKHDSSISGSGRTKAELVTVPMSLRAHKQQWAGFFNALDYEKFDCTTKTNNGMHIHVDRKAFKDPHHIRNLAWMFGNPSNHEFWFVVSERGNKASLNSFAPLPQISSSISKVKAYHQMVDYFKGLRGTLNVSNKATVEIRLFRGVVSFASVLKNLEVVDSLIEFTMDRPFAQLTLNHYMAWLQKTEKNRYTIWKAFLNEIDVAYQMKAVELQDICWNVRETSKVFSILSKIERTWTNEEVTILNRVWGNGRWVILDKATKRLDLIRKDFGKVSHLDKVVAERYKRMVA
jgi:hypothetical protein